MKVRVYHNNVDIYTDVNAKDIVSAIAKVKKNPDKYKWKVEECYDDFWSSENILNEDGLAK